MMDTALLLAANIFPLYILIALGFIGGKWMDVNLPSMATISIYFLSPFVIMGAAMQMEFRAEVMILPILVFGVSALIGLIFYKLAPRAWQDGTGNLIAMASVTGNTGYFGLPIILALFDVQFAAIYLIMNLGISLSELTLGYYYGARGHADMRQAFKKVLRLPVLHGLWIGLALNALDIDPSSIFLRYWDYATGAWVIVGMMLIGIALGKQERLTLDIRLAGWMFTAKFLFWPIGAALIIAADKLVFHAFGPEVHTMIAIMSAVPLAANLVAFASALNLHPERTAGVVLASTLFAFITVPLAVAVMTVVNGW